MLRLIRRHGKFCKHSSTRYRRCDCPIHVYGTLAGEKIRKALDLTSWEAATDLIRGWEASGQIGVVRADIPTVEEAVAKFLDDGRARKLSPETLRKFSNLLESRLVPWCESEGYRLLKQLKTPQLREFRATWDDSPIYALKNLERLRAFFSFCVEAGWIASNPAKAVKAGKVTPNQKIPFTDDEFQKIVAACDRYRGNAERMKAFVLVMRYSGLRISDAISLKRSAVKDGKIFLRTEKTKTEVWVPVPPVVTEALAKLPADGERYFWNGKGALKTRVANWSRYLASVFKLAKVDGAHSHRFRHSFSVALLKKGIPVETVAILLGNSPKIVARHYAAVTADRQKILEDAVRLTW